MLCSVETVRLLRGNPGTRLRTTRSEQKDQKGSSTQTGGSQRTTRFFSLSTRRGVPLHPVQELLPALRVLDVLDPEVHPLLDITVANDLVDNDTNGTRGDIVDDAGSTVAMCKLRVVKSEISRRTLGNICVACPSAELRWP